MDLRIQTLLQKEAILLDVKAVSKEDILAQMVRKLAEGYPILDEQDLLDRLIQREKIGSTGIGSGVAIPHCRTLDVDVPRLVLARSLSGADFQSADGRPVFLIFLLVAPENGEVVHLKVLARIAKLFRVDGFLQDVLAASDEEEIHRVVALHEKRTD